MLADGTYNKSKINNSPHLFLSFYLVVITQILSGLQDSWGHVLFSLSCFLYFVFLFYFVVLTSCLVLSVHFESAIQHYLPVYALVLRPVFCYFWPEFALWILDASAWLLGLPFVSRTLPLTSKVFCTYLWACRVVLSGPICVSLRDVCSCFWQVYLFFRRYLMIWLSCIRGTLILRLHSTNITLQYPQYFGFILAQCESVDHVSVPQ